MRSFTVCLAQLSRLLIENNDLALKIENRFSREHGRRITSPVSIRSEFYTCLLVFARDLSQLGSIEIQSQIKSELFS